MDIVKIPLTELHPSDVNSRKHPEKQVSELVRSIKDFDAIRPIVVDENKTILAGHCLYLALQKIGAETADCIIKDNLSDKAKKKLILADNKIYSMGVDDYTGIEKILSELAADGDFDVPGYDSNILDEMYGIKSVEESAASAIKGADISSFVPVPQGNQENFTPVEPSKPLKQTEETKQKVMAEAEKFIICPNCGERIFINA